MWRSLPQEGTESNQASIVSEAFNFNKDDIEIMAQIANTESVDEKMKKIQKYVDYKIDERKKRLNK